MAQPLDDFKGKFPYASELLGVYQPLLGWKSKMTQDRVDDERTALVEEVVAGMMVDPRYEAAADEPLLIDPKDPGDPTPPLVNPTQIAAYVREEGRKFYEDNNRLPNAKEWKQILSPDQLNAALKSIKQRQPLADKTKVHSEESGNVVLIHKDSLSEEEFKKINAQPLRGTDMMVARKSLMQTVSPFRYETVMAGALNWLSINNPEAIEAVLKPKQRSWEVLLPFIDPLANFDPETTLATLSPLGLVHLYRQYFFEFDTFLGSPVGHIWVSPGGVVELVEVTTRRTLTERVIDILKETTTRSELASLEQDELANSVKEENERNINFGVSASGGANFGVYQVQASANFGISTTNRQAQEVTHKQTRQQSEKLSSEIRRNFHSTFRTTAEVSDTSSRRYVLQNNTNNLLNYELRRKMRRVGVQIQHIGTQMCWQVFVDDPGASLGISELVHIAQPEDVQSSLEPPEAPVALAQKTEPYSVVVPFEGIGNNPDHDNRNELYIDGYEDGDTSDDQIQHIWEFDAPPPGPGYTLASITETSIEPVDPEEGRPSASALYEPIVPARFRITMNQVKFENQPAIRFALQLIWNPPDQAAALADFQKHWAEYTQAKSREGRLAYVRAVRERIEMASSVPKRPTHDLREEERTVIYRRLIRQLMRVGDPESAHVTSELIRAIFDVDSLLYFVGQEWWKPRTRHQQQVQNTRSNNGSRAGTQTLTPGDKIGWGGIGSAGRDNYLITEESEPAPLGSSLGWLIQLDGDDHRNAFLNSPWAKAVIPVRPGREAAALKWLQLAHVEGTDNLDADYQGPEPEYKNADGTPKKLSQVLEILARTLAAQHNDFQNVLATETVYEKGFDPLAGGFVASGKPFEIFDQWVEVLPTDQVVAVEYEVP